MQNVVIFGASGHGSVVLDCIEKEGKWIWPRSKIAALINKLSDAGAKVVAFDIGFLEIFS